MTPSKTPVDRPALVRRALVELVAENGFRGTSMAAVADRAGVATGTAYVHYQSKDDLVVAAFREIKSELSAAAVAGVEPGVGPAQKFGQLWKSVHAHLAADPARARFLIQFESSPLSVGAHADYLAAEDDALMQAAVAKDMAGLLIDVPVKVLFDLGLGPAMRLAASGLDVDQDVLERTANACWRAITR